MESTSSTQRYTELKTPVSTEAMGKEGCISLAEIIAFEHYTVKVPFEMLFKSFQGVQKLIESEMKFIVGKVTALTEPSTPLIIQTINILLERLLSLRNSARDLFVIQENILTSTEKRFVYLHAAPDSKETYCRERMDRIVVDYLLREGHYDVALRLSQQANIEHLVNMEVFLCSRVVERSLGSRDCSMALRWCSDNSLRLAKLKSTLEFKLRMQQFVELVRLEKIPEAVNHAQKYFKDFASKHIGDIQAAMALLVFPVDSIEETYKPLMSADRWSDLIQQFRRNNYVVHCLTAQPLLNITMQCGLSVMKTSQCSEPSSWNRNCPVCSPNLRVLAEDVTSIRRISSSLVCRYLGVDMDEHNPPMMLPNGRVYSQQAITMLTGVTDFVTCPQTNTTFPLVNVKRVFCLS